ncbi:Uncharacterised protein [Mycobacteroides abscessus subsp. abscessus]|nr:Uncharacterised protein [Mycobacteroides abscessus subsp. abscessus]
MATSRAWAWVIIGPWSKAMPGSADTGCQRVSLGSSGVAGEGTRPRKVEAMVRGPGTRLGSEKTASCSRWVNWRRSTFSAS